MHCHISQGLISWFWYILHFDFWTCLMNCLLFHCRVPVYSRPILMSERTIDFSSVIRSIRWNPEHVYRHACVKGSRRLAMMIARGCEKIWRIPKCDRKRELIDIPCLIKYDSLWITMNMRIRTIIKMVFDITKASDAELWCFFICAWTNCRTNNKDAGDLRRNEVTVMYTSAYYILLFIRVSINMINDTYYKQQMFIIVCLGVLSLFRTPCLSLQTSKWYCHGCQDCMTNCCLSRLLLT